MRLIRNVVLAVAIGATPVHAATFDDPDWPCIQVKVPDISIGQMWAGPEVTDEIKGLAREPQVQGMIGPLIVRRNTLDEAEAMIAEFAEGLGTDRVELLTALFWGTFSQISAERRQIIAGIGRYAHKQTALSELIEAKREELVALNAVAEDQKNWDRIEELEDTLVWDERIYKDRQQSLTYVCETPVLMEQRAFGIARAIMGHLE